jgi:cytochrome oxidase Cu insertion factor (SCO1/SenC/PrrC family)
MFEKALEPLLHRIADALDRVAPPAPADGDFNHSSTILLLDTDGRISARTNTLGATDPKLVEAMRKLVAGKP